MSLDINHRRKSFCFLLRRKIESCKISILENIKYLLWMITSPSISATFPRILLHECIENPPESSLQPQKLPRRKILQTHFGLNFDGSVLTRVECFSTFRYNFCLTAFSTHVKNDKFAENIQRTESIFMHI